jgi:hypothetical protein
VPDRLWFRGAAKCYRVNVAANRKYGSGIMAEYCSDGHV